MRMITRSFCALILSAFASLVAATIPAASARADLSFDFNGGNDNGLTHYDPLAPFTGGSTYSFPVLGPGNDGYELTSGPSPDPANSARRASGPTWRPRRSATSKRAWTSSAMMPRIRRPWA